jgi:hypothetical protein
MFERLERPAKILCLAMAVLLVWQLGGLILRGDPLAHLKIPPLPVLPGATNEPAKPAHKETNAPVANKTGTNGTNAAIGTNVSSGTNATIVTNAAKGTNAMIGTNAGNGTNMAKGTNTLAKTTNALAAGEKRPTNAMPGMTPEMMANMPPGMMANMSPEMLAKMKGGGMAMKKIELPADVQARVDQIVDSEVFGRVVRTRLALVGIADQEAFIRATNGQTGPLKVGGEMAGIKLLRIGVNRVLIEQDGEKKELTLFTGIGGESLLPKTTNAPSTNTTSTNSPSTNTTSIHLATRGPSTNQTLSSKKRKSDNAIP